MSKDEFKTTLVLLGFSLYESAIDRAICESIHMAKEHQLIVQIIHKNPYRVRMYYRPNTQRLYSTDDFADAIEYIVFYLELNNE